MIWCSAKQAASRVAALSADSLPAFSEPAGHTNWTGENTNTQTDGLHNKWLQTRRQTNSITSGPICRSTTTLNVQAICFRGRSHTTRQCNVDPDEMRSNVYMAARLTAVMVRDYQCSIVFPMQSHVLWYILLSCFDVLGT